MAEEVKKLNGSAFSKYAYYWSDLAKVEKGEDPFAGIKRIIERDKKNVASKQRVCGGVSSGTVL